MVCEELNSIGRGAPVMVGNLSRSKVKIKRGRAATSVGIPKGASHS